MPRLTHAELSALAEGLRELYAQTEIAPLRETLVRVAARLVPCDVGSYNEIDRLTSKPLISLRLPDCAEYRKQFPAFVAHYAEHPISRFTHKTGRTDAARLSDFVTQRQLGRLPLYNEYYRVLAIRHQMVVFFESNGAIQRAISLKRSNRNFSERDRMVVNLLQPHFLQAYRNAQALTGLRIAASAMEKVQAASAKGILLLGRNGRIEWLSDLSRTWLREYCRAEAGPGSCVPEPIAGWLAQNRERWRKPFQSRPAVALSLRASSGNPTINVDFAAEDQEGNISLVLTRNGSRGEGTHVHISVLTPRENEILGWIATGKSNPEIAAILGLSVRTVYKHVENMFPKLGVENRAAAMLQALDASRAPFGRLHNASSG
jgi:DNA-binding CsgD family transcriptional regulator